MNGMVVSLEMFIGIHHCRMPECPSATGWGHSASVPRRADDPLNGLTRLEECAIKLVFYVSFMCMPPCHTARRSKACLTRRTISDSTRLTPLKMPVLAG